MATVSHTRSSTGTSRAFVATWLNLAEGDQGDALAFGQYTDRSVQVIGALGGATLVVEGSLNGLDWATLTDPQGNDLTITTPKIEMITEATVYIRPRVSGGSGVTDVTVLMLLKEGN
jgi:hypothetical protein